MGTSGKKLTVVLGPTDIYAITNALEVLLPWIDDSKFHILPNGNLEFTDEEPVQAIDLLRNTVEEVLPEEICDLLGDSSGLGWHVFFGHVVAWWLPQKNRVGLLRAFVNRAALHDIDLRLHWNQNRSVDVIERVPDASVLIYGTSISVIAAILATKVFNIDEVFALIIAASGLVGGRIYQRIVVDRICGDALCRSPLGSAEVCPMCGGRARKKR